MLEKSTTEAIERPPRSATAVELTGRLDAGNARELHMRPVLRARRRPETDLLHEQRQVERERHTEMPNLAAHLQPSAA